jgi:hypothetical protein
LAAITVVATALAGPGCPMVLDEGIDVPDADLAIIVAASQSEREMI